MRTIVGTWPLSRLGAVVLWAPCLLILVLVVVNPWGTGNSPPGGDAWHSIGHTGPLFRLIAFPYIALVLVATVIVLIRASRDAPQHLDRRAIVLVFATLVPLSVAVLYTFGNGPWLEYDPAMSGITLSAAACSLVLWRCRLLGLAPLAHGMIIEHLADGVIVLNEAGRVVESNPSAQRVFPSLSKATGMPLDEGLSSSPEAAETVIFMAEEARRRTVTATSGVCPAGRATRGKRPHDQLVSIPGADGESHYSVAVTDICGREGRRLGLAIVLHDATSEIQLLERTRELADTDDLTGLLARRRFLELARHEMERARRHGAPVAVILIDIDGFKLVNDRHGHAAGDQVLREVADACLRNVRPQDLVSRYGGDEFCVLMPGAASAIGHLAAMRLREAVAELTIWHKGEKLGTTVSIGVSGVRQVGDGDISDLLEEADQMLYAAKRAGRDKVIVNAG
jgi:diguanylate cyclase (GGDEF)-like protein